MKVPATTRWSPQRPRRNTEPGFPNAMLSGSAASTLPSQCDSLLAPLVRLVTTPPFQSASTPDVPEPSPGPIWLHVTPSQRANTATLLAPDCVNGPEAMRWMPSETTLRTRLLNPSPTLDHVCDKSSNMAM